MSSLGVLWHKFLQIPSAMDQLLRSEPTPFCPIMHSYDLEDGLCWVTIAICFVRCWFDTSFILPGLQAQQQHVLCLPYFGCLGLVSISSAGLPYFHDGLPSFCSITLHFTAYHLILRFHRLYGRSVHWLVHQSYRTMLSTALLWDWRLAFPRELNWNATGCPCINISSKWSFHREMTSGGTKYIVLNTHSDPAAQDVV